MEAYGPRPGVVGGLLCAVHGKVLIAHGAPDVAAGAAFVAALTSHVAIDARPAVMGVLVPSRAIAAAIATTIDPSVVRRSIAVVADEPIVPSLGVLTLRLHRHQHHGGGKKRN